MKNLKFQYEKYPLKMRIMHWMVGVIIISMLISGIIMTNLDNNSLKWCLYSLHKSFGVTVFPLILLRLIIRFKSIIPPLPYGLPYYSYFISKFVYFLMYVLMILIPFSGYAVSNSFGYPVNWFNIELPKLFEKNEELGQIFAFMHNNFPYILLILIFIHVAAVIKHKYFDKKDILHRMI